MGAALLALKIRKELVGNGTRNGSDTPYQMKDAVQLAAGTTARIDLAERAIQENVTDSGKAVRDEVVTTRHSINNNLEVVIERLAREMEHQTAAIVAAISGRGR